jgi:hypothetical protein
MVSPDGQRLAGADRDNKVVIVQVPGGERRLLPTAIEGFPIAWSVDGRSLLVMEIGKTNQVYRVDLATGRSTQWRQIGPANTTGTQSVIRFFCTPDEKSYVYSFSRSLDRLYVATGWK